jgi:HK97 family phage portal protein
MSWNDKLRSWFGFGLGPETRDIEATPAALKALRINVGEAGAAATFSNVIGLMAVYSCTRVLSEAMGSFPCNLYQRRPDGGRDKLTDVPLARLLTFEAAPNLTPFELFEVTMGHLCLRGNGYWRVQRDGQAVPTALYPLEPDRVQIVTEPNNGRVYRYQPPGGGVRVYPARDIVHVKGLGGDGVVGYNPIKVMREGFSRAIAVDAYGNRFFRNSATASGVLTYPERLTTEAHDRIRDSWARDHGGDKQHAPAILEEGLAWQTISINPDDAQFIESRKLSRSEIAGAFRVPAHLIGDLEGATFSNITEQSLEFLTYTMVPWLERFEQAITRVLIPEQLWGQVYVEFNTNNLLRADPATRFESYSTLLDRGVLSINEVRALENLNPIDNGDVHMVPLNYVPLELVATETEPPAEGGQPVPTGGAGRSGSGAETRANVGLTRKRIERSYRPVLEQAMGRIVRREAEAIRAAAKRHLGTRSEATFEEWLTEFYSDTSYASTQLGPVFGAMAEAVGAAAADEIADLFEMSPQLQRWVNGYVAQFAEVYANRSKAQIIKLLSEAAADADLLELLDERLTEWTEGGPGGRTRAEKTAAAQAVKFGQGFSRAVWVGLGVSAVVWQSYGDSCPYCLDLHGRVVGVTEGFIGAGANYQPEGAGSALTPSTDIFHPPAHSGCDCGIIAGR